MSDNPLAIVDKVAQKSEQATQRAVAAEKDDAVGIAALDDQDALDLLLSCDPAEQIQTVELPPRKGTEKPLHLTLRSITEQEWEVIKEQSTTRGNRAARRRRGAGDEEIVDNSLMARLMVKRATVGLDWNDARLRDRFGAMTGEDVIRKVLLYGEIANLSGIVMELSGFDEDKIQFIEDLSEGEVKPVS